MLFAGHVETVGVVNEPVEDSIGEGGIVADDFVPVIDGYLEG